MSSKKDNATIVGVGTVACAACCAGPILGVLASIGIGTVLGYALFGIAAVVLGAVAITVVVKRRRGRVSDCAPTPGPVAVPEPSGRGRR
jgi:uncharacterized membrane protein